MFYTTASTGAMSKKPFVPGHRKCRSDGASIFLSCSGGGGVASTSEDSLQPWSNSGTLSNAGSDERFRHLGRNSMPCVLWLSYIPILIQNVVLCPCEISQREVRLLGRKFRYSKFTTALSSILSWTTPCSRIPTKRCRFRRRRQRAARRRTLAASANNLRRRG